MPDKDESTDGPNQITIDLGLTFNVLAMRTKIKAWLQSHDKLLLDPKPKKDDDEDEDPQPKPRQISGYHAGLSAVLQSLTEYVLEQLNKHTPVSKTTKLRQVTQKAVQDRLIMDPNLRKVFLVLFEDFNADAVYEDSLSIKKDEIDKLVNKHDKLAFKPKGDELLCHVEWCSALKNYT